VRNRLSPVQASQFPLQQAHDAVAHLVMIITNKTRTRVTGDLLEMLNGIDRFVL
jgi:hypothetical protein